MKLSLLTFAVSLIYTFNLSNSEASVKDDARNLCNSVDDRSILALEKNQIALGMITAYKFAFERALKKKTFKQGIDITKQGIDITEQGSIDGGPEESIETVSLQEQESEAVEPEQFTKTTVAASQPRSSNDELISIPGLKVEKPSASNKKNNATRKNQTHQRVPGRRKKRSSKPHSKTSSVSQTQKKKNRSSEQKKTLAGSRGNGKRVTKKDLTAKNRASHQRHGSRKYKNRIRSGRKLTESDSVTSKTENYVIGTTVSETKTGKPLYECAGLNLPARNSNHFRIMLNEEDFEPEMIYKPISVDRRLSSPVTAERNLMDADPKKSSPTYRQGIPHLNKRRVQGKPEHTSKYKETIVIDSDTDTDTVTPGKKSKNLDNEVLKKPASKKKILKKPASKKKILRKPASKKKILSKPASKKKILSKPASEKRTLRNPAPKKRISRRLVSEEETFKGPVSEKEKSQRPVSEEEKSRSPDNKTFSDNSKQKIKPEENQEENTVLQPITTAENSLSAVASTIQNPPINASEKLQTNTRSKPTSLDSVQLKLEAKVNPNSTDLEKEGAVRNTELTSKQFHKKISVHDPKSQSQLPDDSKKEEETSTDKNEKEETSADKNKKEETSADKNKKEETSSDKNKKEETSSDKNKKEEQIQTLAGKRKLSLSDNTNPDVTTVPSKKVIVGESQQSDESRIMEVDDYENGELDKALRKGSDYKPDERIEDVEHGELEDADSEDTDSEDTDLEDGDVEDTDIEDGDVEDTDIEDGDIEDTDIEAGDIEDTDIENGDIEDANIENGDLEDTDIEDVDLENELDSEARKLSSNNTDSSPYLPDISSDSYIVEDMSHSESSNQSKLREPEFDHYASREETSSSMRRLNEVELSTHFQKAKEPVFRRLGEPLNLVTWGKPKQLSEQCTQCFYLVRSCGMSNCVGSCIMDQCKPECIECGKKFCEKLLLDCLGIPRFANYCLARNK